MRFDAGVRSHFAWWDLVEEIVVEAAAPGAVLANDVVKIFVVPLTMEVVVAEVLIPLNQSLLLVICDLHTWVLAEETRENFYLT